MYTLGNAQLDTTTLWKRDPRLIALPNDKHIPLPRRKSMIGSILNMNNIITPMMSFTMCHHPDTTNIVTRGNHSNIPDIKLDVACDLSGLEVIADGIADFDSRVRVTDCSCVVGDEVGDSLCAELDTFDFAELVFCFFGGDAVDCETAFDIVDQAEILVGFIDGDDV